MKRIGLTILLLGLALSGCAQKKGKQAQEESRLDRLESGFSRFQEQQQARDADIDNKLNKIAVRLDQLTTGWPPTASRKGRAAAKPVATAPTRTVAYGQVIPYTALAAPAPQGRQAAPPIAPAPSSPPSAAPVPSGQPMAATPLVPGTGPAPAPASPPAPGYSAASPVVTLGDASRNVPPAAQVMRRQPAPVPPSPRRRHAGSIPATGPATAPEPKPLAAERQPEPMPAPATPAVPSLEPAVPQPPQAKSPLGKPATPVAPPPASASIDEQRLYTEALRSVSANRNEEGRKKFNEFLAKYPSSVKTPEALYWIGESYMGDKSYNQAILSLKEVTTRFPKDPKAAESLYRIAEAYERLGDKANAAFHLKLITDEHAGSEYAGKARQKLKQLGQ